MTGAAERLTWTELHFVNFSIQSAQLSYFSEHACEAYVNLCGFLRWQVSSDSLTEPRAEKRWSLCIVAIILISVGSLSVLSLFFPVISFLLLFSVLKFHCAESKTEYIYIVVIVIIIAAFIFCYSSNRFPSSLVNTVLPVSLSPFLLKSSFPPISLSLQPLPSPSSPKTWKETSEIVKNLWFGSIIIVIIILTITIIITFYVHSSYYNRHF